MGHLDSGETEKRVLTGRQTEDVELSPQRPVYPKCVCPTSTCPNEGGGREKEERSRTGGLETFLHFKTRRVNFFSVTMLEIGGEDQPTMNASGSKSLRWTENLTSKFQKKARVMVRGKGCVRACATSFSQE